MHKNRITKITILLLSLLLLMGCSVDGDYEVDFYEPSQEPSQNVIYQNQIENDFTYNESVRYVASISLDIAEYLFTRLSELFDADDGYLWGVPLHSPFIFLDTETRDIVANQPDPTGTFEKQGNVYLGTLPNNLIAAYSFPSFNGQSWAVLPWDMIDERIEYTENILRIMVHMSFHVQQPSLFGSSGGWDNSHMNQEFARITIQLEINALIKALRSEGDERLRAIHDALSIRSARRATFGQAQSENIFEVHEGLADYTEARLVKVDMNILLDEIDAMTYWLRNAENIDGVFGYLSGALYGYLLDEIGSPWRESVGYGVDLGVMLQEALGISELSPFDDLDLTPYRYEEILASEAERHENQQGILDDIAMIFAQEPTLTIPSAFEGGNMQLNPMSIFQVDGVGEVYGATVVISGSFGRLELYDGFFARDNITRDGRVIATEMVVEGSRVSASGWVLELEDRFAIQPDGDNFVVVRS